MTKKKRFRPIISLLKGIFSSSQISYSVCLGCFTESVGPRLCAKIIDLDDSSKQSNTLALLSKRRLYFITLSLRMKLPILA